MSQGSINFGVIAGLEPEIQRAADVRGLIRPKPALLRALRLGCVLAAAMALAACGRCGNFLWSSQDAVAACHSDTPPQ
jgi:hypothetical protein